MHAASRLIGDFGIATECGIGRARTLQDPAGTCRSCASLRQLTAVGCATNWLFPWKSPNIGGMARQPWDVVIVGAGPAGLNAALILGRATRRVLLCDTGRPRSWASKAMYGFITRDGVPPAEFRRLAREELKRYPNVAICDAEVTGAVRNGEVGFSVKIGGRRRVKCRKLLIATGVLDVLPAIEGIEQYFGTSVFQCPYCDGWEFRDRALVAYGKRRHGFEMARALTAWSDDVALCTDGPARLSARDLAQLRRNGISLFEDPIAGLVGKRGKLRAIRFQNGERSRCEALFFDMPTRAQSRLSESLGCQQTRHGHIKCGKYEATNVPGVFVAGNIIQDVQLAIVAAAEGARAAFGINRALTREDMKRR
jgi:thioredoxin reductase